MTRKKKETKPGVQTAPIPVPSLHDTRMEIKLCGGGRISVRLFDCTDFITYTHECVSLRWRRRVVRIEGRDLWCRSFGNRVAEITGVIEEMNFTGGADD